MNGDWRVFAVASAFFAALTAVFGKIGVSEMSSGLATFLRTLVIVVVTALLIWARHEWQRPDTLSSRGVLFLVLSGVATGLSWLCYYRALQTGPASRVAPIDKLSVVLVVLFAVLFLGERLTWKVGLAGVLITAGQVLMAVRRRGPLRSLRVGPAEGLARACARERVQVAVCAHGRG